MRSVKINKGGERINRYVLVSFVDEYKDIFLCEHDHACCK